MSTPAGRFADGTIEVLDFSEDGDLYAAFGHHDLREMRQAVERHERELRLWSAEDEPDYSELRMGHCYWYQDPYEDEMGWFQSGATHPSDEVEVLALTWASWDRPVTDLDEVHALPERPCTECGYRSFWGGTHDARWCTLAPPPPPPSDFGGRLVERNLAEGPS